MLPGVGQRANRRNPRLIAIATAIRIITGMMYGQRSVTISTTKAIVPVAICPIADWTIEIIVLDPILIINYSLLNFRSNQPVKLRKITTNTIDDQI